MLLKELSITPIFNVDKLKKQVIAILIDSHIDSQNFKQCLVALGTLDNGEVLKAVYIDNVYNFYK